MDSGADVAGNSAEAKMFHEEHFLPESGSFCGNTTGDSPERRNRWVAQEGGFDLGPLGNRCSTRNIRVTCLRTPRSSRGLIVLFWAARDLPEEHSRKSSSGTTQKHPSIIKCPEKHLREKTLRSPPLQNVPRGTLRLYSPLHVACLAVDALHFPPEPTPASWQPQDFPLSDILSLRLSFPPVFPQPISLSPACTAPIMMPT